MAQGGLKLDHGPSDYDRRHRFTVAYVWDIPGPAGGFWKHALAGWSVAGISAFQSGAPFTVANGFDRNNDTIPNDRPDISNPRAPLNSRAIVTPSSGSQFCATGYRIRFPFLSRAVLKARGKQLPLYRRIVPTGVPDLYFIGLVDPPGGLPPIVAMQSAWLADVLDGSTTLPEPGGMLAAVDQAERRTIQRFPRESPYSIRCDPHAYRRLLAHDRRWALRRASRPT